MKKLFFCLFFLFFAFGLDAANWTNYPLVNAPNPNDTFLIGTTTTNQQLSAGSLSAWLGTNLTLKSDFSVTNLSVYGVGTNALKINSGVITSSLPAIDISQTWSNSGVTFTGLRVNVTDSNSASGSLLADLQVGGASKFSVKKDGEIAIPTGKSFYLNGMSGSAYIYNSGGIVLTPSGSDMFKVDSAGAILRAGNAIQFASSGIGSVDTYLSRDSAATLQLGADAATATAQTIKAHDGSGTDKAGADLSIAAGQGTGAGAGGRIILRTSAAGSSGSSANSYSDVLTATPDGIIGIGITNPTTGKLVISSGVITSSLPAIDISQTWSNSGVAFTGLKVNVADSNSASGSLLLDLQKDGVSLVKVGKSGALATSHGIVVGINDPSYAAIGQLSIWSSGTQRGVLNTLGVIIKNDSGIAWSSTSSSQGTTDTFLYRDSAATIQLGADAATATAQTLKAHDGSGTDKSGADLNIAAGQGTGTGAGGTLNFKTAPAGSTGSSANSYVTRMSIDSTGLITGRELTTSNLTYLPVSLGSAPSTVTIDLKGGSMQYVTMTNNTTIALTNVSIGRNVSVMFIGPTDNQYNLIMPSGIRLYSGAVTNIVTTNKSAVVSFTSFDGVSTNLVTTVAIEP